eukprot:3306712-Alexandrium_andersonii.AAC.1
MGSRKYGRSHTRQGRDPEHKSGEQPRCSEPEDCEKARRLRGDEAAMMRCASRYLLPSKRSVGPWLMCAAVVHDRHQGNTSSLKLWHRERVP